MEEDLDSNTTIQHDVVDLTSFINDIPDEGSVTEGEESSRKHPRSEALILAQSSGTTHEPDDGKFYAFDSEDDNMQTYEEIPIHEISRKRKRTVRRKATTGTRRVLISDDDDGDSHFNIPDYVKQRRNEFEKNRKLLKEAGLKLPPTWDEVDFDTTKSQSRSSQKPKFTTLSPPSKNEDVELEYSGGCIPAPIAKWLRDYQVRGAAFLHEHFVYQRGGILGDDMGTGKTIQAIAFLTAAFGKTGDSRDMKKLTLARRIPGRWHPIILIICPGSLMNNWKSELNLWSYWHIDILHGTESQNVLDLAIGRNTEVVITTFTTYLHKKDQINLVNWDCVIADEFHIMKNRLSKISCAMNEVNSLCRIGLTGTAIQNGYDELWNLLNWTNPGKFGDYQAWIKGISDPLRIGQAHDASVTELARARRTADKLVKNLLPLFFLRRTKSLIADQLPQKRDRVVFCPLSPDQADAYENLVAGDIVDGIRNARRPCECGATKSDDKTPTQQGWCCGKYVRGQRWQTWVFPCIQTLQKLCNHLAMIVPSADDNHEKQERDLENLRIAAPNKWKELFAKRDKLEQHADGNLCGKWSILKKLLHFWKDDGSKVLIFSHSVRLLKIFKTLFDASNYHYSYLDGSLTYDERTEVVDHFNSNPSAFVFLISSKSGGVGLNITSANKVVIVDPHWNPSWDLQAQDRAYRIGQLRDVEVFRLISAGTIEEIVYARQIYKQQMANIGYSASLERRYFKGVQGHSSGEIFGLENMFTYQGEHVALRDIVNKTNIAESKANIMVTNIDLSDHEGYDAANEHASLTDGDPQLEERALNQLADIITGKIEKKIKARKETPYGTEWILAQAGVEYTHDNSEVIGTSKIETDLSRHAMMREQDVDAMQERAFGRNSSGDADKALIKVNSRTIRTSGEEGVITFAKVADRGGEPGTEDETFHDIIREERNHVIKYEYKPDDAMRARQFNSMAQHFRYTSTLEFAQYVESISQERRTKLLEQFYRHRRKEVVVPLLDKNMSINK